MLVTEQQGASVQRGGGRGKCNVLRPDSSAARPGRLAPAPAPAALARCRSFVSSASALCLQPATNRPAATSCCLVLPWPYRNTRLPAVRRHLQFPLAARLTMNGPPASPPRSPVYLNSPALQFSLHEADENPRSSYQSSQVTDVSDNASDIMGLAEAQQSQGASSRPSSLVRSPPPPALGRPSKRVSVGDVQQDGFGTRPSTAMSSSTRNMPASPPSRRGITSSAGGSVRGRPTSSASRTHAPSLTNGAFYRPMSSAKLQAQRGKVTEEDEAEQNRIRGFAQAGQIREGAPIGAGLSLGPIVHQSRPVEKPNPYSPPPASPVRTLPSVNSVSPLHEVPRELPEPKPFESNRRSVGVKRAPTSQRSNRGGSSNDSGSSVGKPKRILQNGHRQKQPNLGKNYEYFLGNMCFCFGGRFQTARDLPMNVLTAMILVVPSALFFGYS